MITVGDVAKAIAKLDSAGRTPMQIVRWLGKNRIRLRVEQVERLVKLERAKELLKLEIAEAKEDRPARMYKAPIVWRP